MNIDRANKLFIFVIGIVSLIFFLIPTGFEGNKIRKNTVWEKAIVLKCDNKDIKRIGMTYIGTQTIVVRILSGCFKGDTVVSENVLLGQISNDKIFNVNQKVLLVIRTRQKDNKLIITASRASESYRFSIIIILFILFTLFLVLFAKWTGIKALLSFIFTALAIWKVLIPLFLKGINPIFIALMITTLSTGVITLLISGFNKKGLTALLGSISGIMLTALLATSFGVFFKIPGTVKDFAESLLYVGFSNHHLADIFISGIFISSAGAVMDVAMDIAVSQEEIKRQNPEISMNNLILSGFRIGRSVIGTMTTTLLFAYSGNFTFVLMTFMHKGNPMQSIINTNFISAEILQTLVGSFGLVLVAPLTAVIGGAIYCYKWKKS